MLDGDWRSHAAIRGIVLAAILAALSGHWLLNYHKEHAQQRQAAAADQREQVEEQRQATCVDIAKRHSFPCVVNSPPAGPSEKYTAYDLQAQQDMAEWAMAMGIVNAFGILVTVVGIVYVAQTLNVRRDAVARAAEANAISREIGEAQARAYVEYKPQSSRILMSTDGTLGIAISGALTVVGQSPATNMSAGLWVGSQKPDFLVNPPNVSMSIVRSYGAPLVTLENVKLQVPFKNFDFDWRASDEF